MWQRFKKYFFSGLAVFLPLALTIYVSIGVLNFAESIFGRYLRPFFLQNYDFYFWGLGIVTLVVIILFCGFLITNYFGRFIHRQAEKILLRIPLVGHVYPAFKEIAKFLFREEASGFQQVVLISWPQKGQYALAFMTNKTAAFICEKTGREMINVLMPHVPNPLTGFLIIVPRDEAIFLDITVEEAAKMIVSGGVVNPELIHGKKVPPQG
ncbi:MAG: DUF502 domain-containing protein [Candidatus Omnitrophica bacterium]|nr:DUF502 domain-containing protein [Candidatus Omnitrophota bacterium]